MSKAERLDIQLRRARLRREAWRIGSPAVLMVVVFAVYSLWSAAGWSWWYVPLTLAAVVVGAWVTRLKADVTEETTRWFWRAPK